MRHLLARQPSKRFLPFIYCTGEEVDEWAEDALERYLPILAHGSHPVDCPDCLEKESRQVNVGDCPECGDMVSWVGVHRSWVLCTPCQGERGEER